ncbi:MAG: serine hydrolase domain-containing protein [Nitrospirales bacterium]
MDSVTTALQTAVEDAVFPGAVLAVRVRERLVYLQAVGLTACPPGGHPVSIQTIYDLASLTKPLATTSAILWLVQRGALTLDSPLESVLGELSDVPLGSATLVDLLSHSAGLPAWRPYYERLVPSEEPAAPLLDNPPARQRALPLIRDEALLAPIGAKSVYSDLGFILLGLIVERVSGQPLDRFCADQLFDPLHASPLGFVPATKLGVAPTPPVQWQAPIAATEEDPWRGRLLRGEVHDENAYALGGVAGHAGLFGTAEAVLALSRAWLRGYLEQSSLFQAGWVRRFTRRAEHVPGSSWALGWDTPSPPSSSGRHFSRQAFGHLGFTGTSLWIDPEVELEVVLLSNRVHPSRRNNAIQRFRPLIHDLVYEEFVRN